MLFLRLFGQAELHASDGRELRPILSQPKRLALLAYLAAARPLGFQRRDTLLGLFWPDLDQERGRAALRQALYTLRQALGPDVVITRGDGEVAIDPEQLSCDVVQFRALRAHDAARAMHLYAGDLLNGFFIPEAPEFERWLEEERWLLRREAATTAWAHAESLRESDAEAAANWAVRAASLDPFNEAAVRRLMRLLAQAEHRAHALQVYQNFARMLERELDTAPSEETQALAASLRVAPGRSNGSATPTLELADVPSFRKPRSRAWAVLAAAVIAVPVVVGVWHRVIARTAPKVVAVGIIQGDGSLHDMLATSLARVDGLQVISNTRLLELARGDTSAAAVAQAARNAHADRLLEGTLYRDVNGGLRLSLQWMDLRTGRVRSAADVAERSEFELVDAATSELANALSLKPPASRFAAVTTTSLQAYRLYEEGVRAYYAEEHTTAERMLRAAVRADSTFAVAWWYLSRVARYPQGMEYAAKAARLAEHATDRERLVIRSWYLKEMDDPARLPAAETLAVRYPAEPDGPYLLGYDRMWSGDFTGAIPYFERAVALDSASLHEAAPERCLACQALSEVGTALALADSGPALYRRAKRWTTDMPQWRAGWMHLAVALEMLGRYDEAVNARAMMNGIPPANYRDINTAETYIRAGNFRAADAMLLDRVRTGDEDLQSDALYKYALSLRNQNRYPEALRATLRLRTMGNGDAPSIFSAIPQAYTLLEMGRAREAAAIFDSIARPAYTQTSKARNARASASALARSAEAYAAAGDTARVKLLLDSIVYWGRYTAFGPSRQLHHHVRGLLLAARGDHAAAAREFRAALITPTNGWTRTNYHLAQELIAIGRPAEAGAVLGSALRGVVGGGGYGLTHRALHELAATAWRAAGRPDSARAHEEWLNHTTRGASD